MEEKKINVTEEKSAKEIFAENLRYYLAESGKRQVDLSRAVGVSTGTAADWCMARSYPRMDKVEIIADFLGIQISDLINERPTTEESRLEQERFEIAKDISENPHNLNLYLKIKKLSPQDKEIVEALINNLEGRVK